METFASYNPATGECAATYPLCDADEVACTVARAEAGQRAWSGLSVRERCEALNRLKSAVAAHADILARTVADEIGKPLQDALASDVLSVVTGLDWLTKNAPRLLQTRTLNRGQSRVTAVPFGVVGVIGTWNYPLFLDVMPIAFALAAGNAVVWKPSELATGSAFAIYPLLQRAGLPVELVTGDGTTGRALCQSEIAKLAFTGGMATGRAILGELAKRGAPSVMELSGNDALIVCRDADIATAAASAVWARVCNAGQSCVSPQRVYVAREVVKPFVQACDKIMQTLRPGADYGPLRTDQFRQRVGELVEDACNGGARILCGGKSLLHRPGYWYAPTLITDCRDEMRVMREDFFGPVLPIAAFDTEDEAIARANNSEMGLGAAVWTRDQRRGRALASRLRAGTVALNTETLMLGANPALPFGGMGASGYGRQRGPQGLLEWVQWQAISSASTGGGRHRFPYRLATVPLLQAVIMLQAAQGMRAKLRAGRALAFAAMNWNRAEEKTN